MNRVLSFSKHCNRAIHHRCETQLQTAGPVASLIKSRSVIRFRGPDTVKFLQGLLTNDIRKFGEPIGDKTANLPTPMQIQGGPSGQTNHIRLPEIRVSKASVFRGKSKPSTSNCCTNKSKPCKSNTWNP